MRIESFHIQGFKNIANVKIEGLSNINVFYGLNNVGKSNIFEALGLWYQLSVLPPATDLSKQEFEEKFGPFIFQLKGDNAINLKVEITLTQSDLPDKDELDSSLFDDMIGNPKLDYYTTTDLTKGIYLLSEARLDLKANKVELQTTHQLKIGQKEFQISFQSLPNFFSGLHIIEATRRFQVEQRGQETSVGFISDHNLKQALFYAYLSRDLQQKHRLEAIKRILTNPPFNLGELDVALDPSTDRIDIGFIRPDGRLPLENLGSGAQQLLLVLGQIFLNDHPIIAIEEPEMNLSPQYQQYLLVALRQLMQDPAVKLNQLFISTHSPYFEFEENFFDVTVNQQGVTQVARLTVEHRTRYFPDMQVGPETGARLNSLNQVKLYDGVMKDLGLQRGDLVLFTKNQAGRWEIRPEHEIIHELETVQDNNKPNG